MESLAEWRITDTGWLQVWEDADRAGTALLNLAVNDLSAHLHGLASRGLTPGEIQTVKKGVQLSVDVVEIDAGHCPHASRPDELAAVLDSLSG